MSEMLSAQEAMEALSQWLAVTDGALSVSFRGGRYHASIRSNRNKSQNAVTKMFHSGGCETMQEAVSRAVHSAGWEEDP